MADNILQPMLVPWRVSSTPELDVKVEETGDAIATFEVSTLPSLDPRNSEGHPLRVLVVFRAGQWVRTAPAASDSYALDRSKFSFERIETIPTQHVTDMEEFNRAWESEGVCPQPDFFEVLSSSWLREVHGERWKLKHYLVVGHDMYLEVLARETSWEWMTWVPARRPSR